MARYLFDPKIGEHRRADKIRAARRILSVDSRLARRAAELQMNQRLKGRTGEDTKRINSRYSIGIPIDVCLGRQTVEVRA